MGQACADLEPDRTDPTVSIDVRQASELAGGLISILATSTDGREAFRSVSTPEAAGTSVIALLLLPSNAASVTLALSAAKSDEPAPKPAPTPPKVLVPTEQPNASAASATSVTVGGNVFAATHVGFGEGSALGVGVNGTMDVTIDETWAVGAHARIEPGSFNLAREQTGGTFGAGPEAAYRFDVPKVGLLDLGVGADVLATIASYEEERPRADEATDTEPNPEGPRDRSDHAVLDVRARVFGRLALPMPLFSLVVLAGVDVSPVALADKRRGREENVLAPVGLELGIGLGFRSDELGGAP